VRRRFVWAIPSMALLALIILAGCASAPGARLPSDLLTPAALPLSATTIQLPPALPDVAAGGTIYGARCLACHGATGQGDGLQAAQVRAQGGQVAKLVSSSLAQGATPAEWFDVVSNGRVDKLMPGFAQTLTPQERWDALSTIWAMAVTTPALPALQRTYAAACLACHGPAGKGAGRDGPSLADPQWLARNSLADMTAAMISGTVHSQVSLDEQQRLGLAAYVRSFGYRYFDPVASIRSAYSGAGVVRIQALNGTPNGAPVAGLPVALHTYNATGEVFSRTATIDQQGSVTFAALPQDSTLYYQAELIYSGARFFSAPLQFSTTQQISDTLPVYEVTNDPGVISVSAFHFFVQDIGEGFINVVEFYSFQNVSDHAYSNRLSTDSQRRSLQLSLPADASDVTFDGPGLGNRFFQEGLTIYDSDAVPPGDQATTVVMMYNLPYHASREISRPMAYPVVKWDVLLPDNLLRISDMRDNGLQAFHTGSIRTYVPEKNGLAKGETLSFHLVGQPRTLTVAGGDNGTLLMSILLLAAAMLAAIVLVVKLRRSRTVEYAPGNERKTLLLQIADLDNRFSAGNIGEVDYRSTRFRLKKTLLEIWESGNL
jgi:mono/diheme cytochrome c family protein